MFHLETKCRFASSYLVRGMKRVKTDSQYFAPYVGTSLYSDLAFCMLTYCSVSTAAGRVYKVVDTT
jgi:hypothetical protein